MDTGLPQVNLTGEDWRKINNLMLQYKIAGREISPGTAEDMYANLYSARSKDALNRYGLARNLALKEENFRENQGLEEKKLRLQNEAGWGSALSSLGTGAVGAYRLGMLGGK